MLGCNCFAIKLFFERAKMAIESLGIAALMRRQRTLRREGTSSSSSIYYNAAFHLCRSLSNISLPCCWVASFFMSDAFEIVWVVIFDGFYEDIRNIRASGTQIRSFTNSTCKHSTTSNATPPLLLLPSPFYSQRNQHGRRRISNPHRPLQWPWCHYSRLLCICYLICPRSQFHRRHMQITVCYFSFFLYLYDILCISLCVLDDEPYNFCLTYIFWSVAPSIYHHHHQFTIIIHTIHII